MKIWVTSRTDKMPMMNVEAESTGDVQFLAELKGQLDRAREAAIEEGLCSTDGETCGTVSDADGFSKLKFPIMLGEVEFVYPEDFPPKQEDREAVRLVGKRNPRRHGI